MTAASARSLLGTAVVALMLSAVTTLPAQNVSDVETHKGWMNDASDAQEDFRAALVDKDAKAAADAMTKTEQLMAQTEAYWFERKMQDGVRLAQAARTLAASAAASARAGNLSEASETFGKMNATCNSCHELHLEKR
jgi:hypothetical protein